MTPRAALAAATADVIVLALQIAAALADAEDSLKICRSLLKSSVGFLI
jgi:hypothetical protein